MKHLLIIGARGYGRGLYDIASSMVEFGSSFDIKGYLDDKEDALDGYHNYPNIIDSVENYCIQPDDVFACALGDVKYKKKYVEIIKNKGGHFMTIIHPSAHIGNNCQMGEGVIVGYNAQIDCDTVIGNFVNIQTNVVVGHDSKIGNWCILDCFTFTGGFVTIEDEVTMHTGSVVIPRLKIGKGATLNVGSVVIRNVSEDSVMMGNPAKELHFPSTMSFPR